MFILMTFTAPNIPSLLLRYFLNSASYLINLVWILLLTGINHVICPTVTFPLELPTTSLMDLQAALTTCQAASFSTKKQLQSLLGKLSFLTACVKSGIIFMTRLLNSLCECKRPAGHCYPISATLISCSTFLADSF